MPAAETTAPKVKEDLKVKETGAIKDPNFRPSGFADFIGQKKTLRRLQTMTQAVLKRKDTLAHVLLSGPPGVGKTSLALVLGHELKAPVKITSGPVFEKAVDIAAVLTQLDKGDILFIDEIHRMPRAIEEYLYSAMEDFRLDILLPDQKTVRLTLPPFTLVAATTRPGLLSAPLLSRFTLHSHLEIYTQQEIRDIIVRNAGKRGLSLTSAAVDVLARASRGTPRNVNNLLSFASDHALVNHLKQVDEATALQILQVLGITPEGLHEQDQRVLRYLYQVDERSVGLNTLATALGESPDSIEEIYEPFLIQSGYLLRTPSGRRLSSDGLLIAQRLTCEAK